jgi:hypothetical protein
MPDIADLDRAVDALLAAPIVAPTDAAIVMTHGRARNRRRRTAGIGALAMTAALAATVIVVARPARNATVRIETRDDPTTSAAPATTVTAAPVTHISADSQFEATALPDGIHLQNLEVFPAQNGAPPNVMAGYGDDTKERVSVLASPLGSQTPEAALATVPGGDGSGQRITIDGRPAVIGHSVEQPDVPFVSWAVDGSMVELGGQNGTSIEELIRFASSLRPTSVSQPPGMYVVRGGLLFVWRDGVLVSTKASRSD